MTGTVLEGVHYQEGLCRVWVVLLIWGQGCIDGVQNLKCKFTRTGDGDLAGGGALPDSVGVSLSLSLSVWASHEQVTGTALKGVHYQNIHVHTFVYPEAQPPRLTLIPTPTLSPTPTCTPSSSALLSLQALEGP